LVSNTSCFLPRRFRASSAGDESAPSKVIEFPTASPGKAKPKAEPKMDLREVKRLAKQAMQALEKGKQIAAFNFLKRIAEA
jgi:hypothetical protein